MEPEERDVEVFERIPWESLEKSSDRRWLAYLAAGVILLAAVGVSVGRGIGSPPAVPPATTLAVAPTSVVPPPSVTPSTTSRFAPLSEADLMAVPVGSLEASAAAVAEWFVADWFTRDGSGETSGRSFVEWAGAVETSWASSTLLDVTVVIRRLAAAGDDPYRRIPDEAWGVTAELREDGWVVVQGPMAADAPSIPSDLAPVEGDVPASVADRTVDGMPVGAVESEEGWLVEVEWEDEAGLIWPVRRLVPDSSSQ